MRPLGSKSSDLAPTPQRRALRPSTPGAFAGRQSLHPLCRRSALHPGDFLMRRKSPKTHQGPPGPWTPGEGGLAPFDPLASCPSGIVCDNLNPQTSSEAILPRHGLTTESMATVKHREKNKTDLPTQLKVANRSIFLAEGSPARCVSERKKGGNYALAGSRGAALGAPLVTFPATGKSPGVGGAERPPHRGVQRGQHLW